MILPNHIDYDSGEAWVFFFAARYPKLEFLQSAIPLSEVPSFRKHKIISGRSPSFACNWRNYRFQLPHVNWETFWSLQKIYKALKTRENVSSTLKKTGPKSGIFYVNSSLYVRQGL